MLYGTRARRKICSGPRRHAGAGTGHWQGTAGGSWRRCRHRCRVCSGCRAQSYRVTWPARRMPRLPDCCFLFANLDAIFRMRLSATNSAGKAARDYSVYIRPGQKVTTCSARCVRTFQCAVQPATDPPSPNPKRRDFRRLPVGSRGRENDPVRALARWGGLSNGRPCSRTWRRTW
jgi:hypothetical protein